MGQAGGEGEPEIGKNSWDGGAGGSCGGAGGSPGQTGPLFRAWLFSQDARIPSIGGRSRNESSGEAGLDLTHSQQFLPREGLFSKGKGGGETAYGVETV